jgi:hypothetical protein
MYSKDKLLEFSLPPLDAKEFDRLRSEIKVPDVRNLDFTNFKHTAAKHFAENKSNQLKGFDSFPQLDIIVGCQQYIDNLISKNGLTGLQIFEHDYHYYKKLQPQIKYVTLETLDNTRPLLMAMPFPGHLGKHRDLEKIIQVCNNKKIDLHLDCSWIVSAFDIKFNFDQPCIKSFAMSFSKAYCLHWNKVGIRWSRANDRHDSVTILNETNAVSRHTLYVAQKYMESFPIDHLCQKHKEEYFQICKSLRLKPSNIIHACFSIDRMKLYGLKNFFY